MGRVVALVRHLDGMGDSGETGLSGNLSTTHRWEPGGRRTSATDGGPDSRVNAGHQGPPFGVR